MLKGPLILLVVGLTTITLCVLDRSAGWLRVLRPLPGIGVMSLVFLPWLVTIAVRSGGEFLAIALGPSMLGKVASGQQSHGLPPGTYLLLYWLTFWPAAGLVIPAATWIWRKRKERAYRFCLAWAVPTWIVFELIVTKLPHYVLPVYPAIATLLAAALCDGRRFARPIAWLAVSGGVIYLLLGTGLLYALEREFSLATALFGIAGAAMFGWALLNGRTLSARGFASGLVLGAVLLHTAMFGFAVPALDSVWVVPRVVAAAERNAACARPLIASAGLHEPSLVFLGGTKTELTSGIGAAEFLQAEGCRVALVERRDEPQFLARLGELGRQATLRERVTGLPIGRVRRVDIGVYTASP